MRSIIRSIGPENTVYELTDAGRDLREPVHALIRWGGRWMLSGPGNDQFRAGWLVLALDALGVGARMDNDAVVELIVEDSRLRITAVEGHLGISDGSDREPQFRVAGKAPAILGLAAGALSPAQALGQLNLEPAGPDTEQAFTQIFAPSVQGGEPSGRMKAVDAAHL